MAISYRSSNPVLNNKFMAALTGVETMSLQGSLRKIGLLLTMTIISAFATALICLNAGENMFLYAGIFAMVGSIVGFILAIITFVSRPQNPAALMGLYALFEGMLVGGMSLVLEAQY